MKNKDAGGYWCEEKSSQVAQTDTNSVLRCSYRTVMIELVHAYTTFVAVGRGHWPIDRALAALNEGCRRGCFRFRSCATATRSLSAACPVCVSVFPSPTAATGHWPHPCVTTMERSSSSYSILDVAFVRAACTLSRRIDHLGIRVHDPWIAACCGWVKPFKKKRWREERN